MPARHLLLVLGDQLAPDAPLLAAGDPARDVVWMAEVAEESTHVWSAKARTALFLSAMRHFRDRVRAAGWRLRYTALDDASNTGTLAGELARAIAAERPEALVVLEPGDHRVAAALAEVGRAHGLPLEIRDDPHFLCPPDRFRAHAEGRKQLRLEYFYREMRRLHGILLEPDGTPAGGEWNYDAENRSSFGAEGPRDLHPPRRFPPDAITREVLALVARTFADHPGALDDFDWPVTPEEARAALDDFIDYRLATFGRWQDAIWEGEPWLHHSRLAAAMNLHLLDPREVIAEAERAWRQGRVPLESAEGFIRQVLGWREYVRGIHRLGGLGYVDRNALGATGDLPAFYWSGETQMACLRDAISQTLRLGYAHHIQRLMVTGLYALLLGVRPREVHAWYLAVYVDAVEWVELPNTLGMSQYADGGLMASKPYVASGKYLARMSNHCGGCAFDPGEATGERACPFTTLYWDFLARHEAALRANPRMTMQLRNLARLPAARRREIAARAEAIRAGGGEPPPT
jgi:deoxyribodipyrimidine photolyase-related protein